MRMRVALRSSGINRSRASTSRTTACPCLNSEPQLNASRLTRRLQLARGLSGGLRWQQQQPQAAQHPGSARRLDTLGTGRPGFTRTRTGEVQSRITNDIGGMQSVVTSTTTSIAANLTTVVATGAAVSYAVGRWGADLPADREE